MWKWGLFVVAVIAVAGLGRLADPWFSRAAEPGTTAPLTRPTDGTPVDQKVGEPVPVAEKNAVSRIAHVTVYPNSALVTREVEVPAGAGAIELVVTPLPPMTINSSLYSEGSDGIRVLSTRFRTRQLKEDTREEVRKMLDQQKLLQQAIEKLDADIRTGNENLQLIMKLENFTAANTHSATEKGTLNAETIIALSKHVMEQRTEKTRELIKLSQDKQDKTEQLEFLHRQLKEATPSQPKIERDAIIVLDKTNKEAGIVRLNYLVDMAVWRPQYKFRAGKDEKEPVQVEYLAAVVQQSGEDWNNVALTLSTAQPMLNAVPPDLKMLEVAVLPRGANPNNPTLAQQPPNAPAQLGQFGQTGTNMPFQPGNAVDLDNQAKQLRSQAVKEYNKRDVAQGSLTVNTAAALEQANDLVNADERTAEKLQKGKPMARSPSGEGPSVTYHLKAKLSVPSRNDEQVVEVARLEMAPDYFYKAVPILSPNVYRLANLSNKTDFVLLPGEATMYQGTDFVGRMNLPLVAIGEQYEVGFGADPQLQVQRQMIEKSRSMQGGNQVLKYEYRILLSSYKPQAVTVQLWDRLPLAENETVAVNLVKTSPDVCKDPLYVREQRPKNLLRWDLKVEPTMSGEKAMSIEYEFQLALDKQMTISTFSTR